MALDATIVINLINMGQLPILPTLRGFELWVPNHVSEEVHRRAHRLRFRKALRESWIKEFEITDLAETEAYAQYRARFGPGESACMAAAKTRGWTVASDDRVVKREVTTLFGVDRLIDTKGLLEAALVGGSLNRVTFEAICKRFGL